jgi:hypothetical protein
MQMSESNADVVKVVAGSETTQNNLAVGSKAFNDAVWRGRFLPENERNKYHTLLVQDALTRNLRDKDGFPDFDMMLGVRIGLSEMER